MRQRYRSFVMVVVLVLASLALPAFASVSAQEATAEAAPSCGSFTTTMPGETLPAGVTRETVQTMTVGVESLQWQAVSSILCIGAGVTIQVPGATQATLSQVLVRGQVTLVVIEGTLEVKLDRLCADGFTCTETPGMARVHDPMATGDVNLTADMWTPLSQGTTLYIYESTLEFRTPADNFARVLTSGVVESSGGGGCPTSCWTFP